MHFYWDKIPAAHSELLTLHECVECARSWQVGGDGDVLFAGAFCPDANWAVYVCAEAAHPSGGVSDVSQTPIAVVPAKKHMDVDQSNEKKDVGKCMNSAQRCVINVLIIIHADQVSMNVFRHINVSNEFHCQLWYTVNMTCCLGLTVAVVITGRNREFLVESSPGVTNCVNLSTLAVNTGANSSMMSAARNKPNQN